MQKDLVERLHKDFKASRHEKDGVEFWFARELQELLEYSEWRNFEKVIEKAKTACKNAKQDSDNHFVDVNKMVIIGSGAEANTADVMLTRYACYLIAQNGDPRKPVIAFAQSYFALQTRKQEQLIERIEIIERLQARKKLSETETRLSKNIFQRGVDEKGFGRIRSKGDTALFGGLKTADMKKRLGIKSGALANKLPTITIKAKDFATELTNFNVERDDLQGEGAITKVHVKNNTDVRKLLGERGIKPEELPAEADISTLERKMRLEEKMRVDTGNTLRPKPS